MDNLNEPVRVIGTNAERLALATPPASEIGHIIYFTETDTATLGDEYALINGTWVQTKVGGVVKVALKNGHGQEGANKIAAIVLDGTSQATASIPEQRVIVHNASSAIIFIEAGAGAVAVSGTSQPLAASASVEIFKSADSEIAVIGTAAAGNVHFSPQVAINE